MRRVLAFLIIAILTFGASAWAQEAQLPKLNWIEKPTGDDIVRYYPEIAAEQRVNGAVLLCCQPQADGRVNCAPGVESPMGFEFGLAAMQVARGFKMSAADAAFWLQRNELVGIRLRFKIAEPQAAEAGTEGSTLPKDTKGICAKITQEQISKANEALEQAVPKVVWTKKPDGNTFSKYYPVYAATKGVSGAAVLCCLPEDDGHLRCTSAVDVPKPYNFGEAAVRVSRSFIMSQADVQLWRQRNEFIEIPLRFLIGGRSPKVDAALSEFSARAKGICAKIAQAQISAAQTPEVPISQPQPSPAGE